MKGKKVHDETERKCFYRLARPTKGRQEKKEGQDDQETTP